MSKNLMMQPVQASELVSVQGGSVLTRFLARLRDIIITCPPIEPDDLDYAPPGSMGDGYKS